jgi:hypothetical protein
LLQLLLGLLLLVVAPVIVRRLPPSDASPLPPLLLSCLAFCGCAPIL